MSILAWKNMPKCTNKWWQWDNYCPRSLSVWTFHHCCFVSRRFILYWVDCLSKYTIFLGMKRKETLKKKFHNCVFLQNKLQCLLQRRAQEPLLNIINGMFNIHHYKHVDRAYIFKGTSPNVVLIKSVYVCEYSSLAGSADLEWGVHHNSLSALLLKVYILYNILYDYSGWIDNHYYFC